MYTLLTDCLNCYTFDLDRRCLLFCAFVICSIKNCTLMPCLKVTLERLLEKWEAHFTKSYLSTKVKPILDAFLNVNDLSAT